MAENQGDWRSEAFRRKVIQQIDEAVRSSNTPMPKPSVEMENHVYQKAKSREEYLALVARLILHVKDFNNQRRENKMMQKGPNQQMPGPGGVMPQAAGIQDPINALQNMAMSGGSIAQSQPGMMGPGQQMPGQMGQQMRHPLSQQMQPQQQQQQPRMQGQPRPQLQRQDAFIVTSSQNIQQPPMSQQSMNQQSMNQQSQQSMTQQSMAQQSMAQQSMAQQSMAQQSMSQQPMSQQSMAQQSMSQQSMAQQSMAQQTQQSMAQQSMGQQSQQSMNQQSMNQQSMSGPQSSPIGFGTSLLRHSPFSNLGNQASPLVNSNPPSQASPAPQSQMVGSPIPMMMTSPGGIVPSPVSRTMTGAPSPGVSLNTPGNPNSQAAIPSPASQADEHAYLEKLKQLSKHIDPLRRMIKRTEDGKESDHRQNDINKLKNLYDILTNPSKRVPMATLMKCEQVLEKLQFSTKIHSHHTPQVHMCQPLLDAVAAHMTSPTINHTLQNTFGPAMSAMFGNPIKAPTPPPKRRKLEEKSRVPDILQGEIARLDRRFRVKIDPLQHPGSRNIQLICKLDDQFLPCVPPIIVMIPHDYPESSPECSTIRKDYEATPFLRSIQKALVTHLLDLPSTFSFTSLLDMWEMSVRKACCPTT